MFESSNSGERIGLHTCNEIVMPSPGKADTNQAASVRGGNYALRFKNYKYGAVSSREFSSGRGGTHGARARGSNCRYIVEMTVILAAAAAARSKDCNGRVECKRRTEQSIRFGLFNLFTLNSPVYSAVQQSVSAFLPVWPRV